jgi:hypothetical protein
MSKGHGLIERLVLEALKWNRRRVNRGMFCMGADAAMLVRYIRVAKATGAGRNFNTGGDPAQALLLDEEGRMVTDDEGRPMRKGGPPPTRSELESVRRALRNLRKQGLVQSPIKYRHVVYLGKGPIR